MNSIDVEKLSRTFNGLKAVDDVSFSVEGGEIFGFLGHNGAGKTTTIRMLSGQLLPTSGRAQVAGCDVITEQRRLKPLIGVVSEHQNLYERMSGRENLEFAVRLYGQDVRRVNETLKQVDLLDRAKDNVRTYSNGMKQRLLIARALLHQSRSWSKLCKGYLRERREPQHRSERSRCWKTIRATRERRSGAYVTHC